MKNIIYKKENGIARITLNRPKAMNAFTEELFAETKEALIDAEADEHIKVIIFNGTGRAFSVGMDLTVIDLKGFTSDGTTLTAGYAMSDLIEKSKKVTIAQVHGYCFTAGLELMLFFDLAYCTEGTQFGDTHAKFGLIPRWGLSARLTRRVGVIKAKEMSYRAMRVKGAEAERIGLVNRAYKDEEELATEVNKAANDIIKNSFKAIQVTKELYDQRYRMDLDAGVAYELAKDPTEMHTQEELMALIKKNDCIASLIVQVLHPFKIPHSKFKINLRDRKFIQPTRKDSTSHRRGKRYRCDDYPRTNRIWCKGIYLFSVRRCLCSLCGENEQFRKRKL